MTEEWRPIADFPDYEVSSLGRVRRVVAAGGAHVGFMPKTRIDLNGYECARLRRDGKTHTRFVSRLVGAAFLGLEKEGMINHFNGDPADSAAIRVATFEQIRRKGRGNPEASSRFKGVYWWLAKGEWHAEIRVDGRKKHLGGFASEHDAARAYDRAAFQAWGDDAFLNFPDEAESLQQGAAE